MDKLLVSISSVWQIKHTKNCNICKDCALEFSDLESYVSLHLDYQESIILKVVEFQ
jgi:hypothetical protein